MLNSCIIFKDLSTLCPYVMRIRLHFVNGPVQYRISKHCLDTGLKFVADMRGEAAPLRHNAFPPRTLIVAHRWAVVKYCLSVQCFASANAHIRQNGAGAAQCQRQWVGIGEGIAEALRAD